MSVRLTLRRLAAMELAVNAMLAGEQGEGDWDEAVSESDLSSAASWIAEQIAKRSKSGRDEGRF